MFEKIVNSKIYNIVDRIVRVFWVNILMIGTIVLGLFFFTFGPAVLAGTYVIKLIYQKYEGPILPLYIKAFKRFYKKGTSIFLIYSLVIFVLAFNIFFFIKQMEEVFTWLSFISFMIMFIAFGIAVISMFHTLLLSTCFPSSKNIDLIKSGIKLTFAFILRGILFGFLVLGLIALTWLVPIIVFLISFYFLALAIEFILFKPYSSVKIFNNVSDNIADELTL